MAHATQLDVVKRGATVWNECRQNLGKRPGPRKIVHVSHGPGHGGATWASRNGLDLTNAGLVGYDLAGANLAGVDLMGANLQGSDLSGANGAILVVPLFATVFVSVASFILMPLTSVVFGLGWGGPTRDREVRAKRSTKVLIMLFADEVFAGLVTGFVSMWFAVVLFRWLRAPLSWIVVVLLALSLAVKGFRSARACWANSAGWGSLDAPYDVVFTIMGVAGIVYAGFRFLRE